ncbi:hypothetical protein [Candidatus Ichthyocystis sparus]|nr:hypothetical protein [Candidatus Ichthyocystis sparus]
MCCIADIYSSSPESPVLTREVALTTEDVVSASAALVGESTSVLHYHLSI